MAATRSNTTQAPYGSQFEIAMENRVDDVRSVRQLAVSAAAVEVAPNSNEASAAKRKGLVLYNSGSADVLLCFGSEPATATRWNMKLKPDEMWWAYGLRCRVTAIRSTANTTLQVGEVL